MCHALLKLLMLMALLAKALGAAAQPPVMLTVDFRLTRLESDEAIAGAAVRLVLGEAEDIRMPGAGRRFVTDADGRARLTMPVVMDRRWISVPVAQTGLSTPRRVDHLRMAVELEQALPQADGRLLARPWLHLLDIDCIGTDTCATSGIGIAYLQDDNGQWTRPVHFGKLNRQVPELGGLVLSEPGYVAANFLLSPDDAERSRWTLRLVLQRRPVPVRR